MSAAVQARIDELVTAAKQQTGLDDLGADTWREGLEVAVTSALTEAAFNDYGAQYFFGGLTRSLVIRLQVEDWYRRHPEIDEQDVVIEFLGVGFPRTGSTALSHMISEDDAFRNLLIWEQNDPCPPPGLSTEDDARRLAAAEATVTMSKSYVDARLLSMLPRSPHGPMEDHDLMGLEFKNQALLVQGRLPSYAAWYLQCDMEPTYRYEKRVFKLLQWKTPQKVWRVKSPTHTLFLDDYLKVFPGTKFVQTHRDISKVLPSVSDLYFTMLSVGNPTIDPLYVGELNMEQWGVALDRMLAFRADPAHDAMFFDIGFTAFQADPVKEITKLYEWLGDELRPETIERMLAWREDNPKDKHGKHTYDGAQFGLTEEALANRYGAYRERFGALLN